MTTTHHPDFNIQIDVDAMLAGLPHELDRIVVSALRSHIGRQNAISRRELLEKLRPAVIALGMRPARLDRNVRLAINRARKAGHLICATGGMNGGYFLAADQDELDAYLQVEVHSRAMDLLEQEKAMRTGAARLWPDQASMF